MSPISDHCGPPIGGDVLPDEQERTTRSQRFVVYLSVVGLALLLRSLCLAHQAFYCDVGSSQKAIESGAMRIQFPGYVAYHLSVLLLAKFTSNPFSGFLVFTVVIDILTVVYVMLAAEVIGGLRAALAGGMVAACGLLGVYFSGTGTSYPTDALAAAGVVYYGLKLIYRTPDVADVLKAHFWCLFGIAMRPLSSVWLLPAVIYLVWKKGGRRTTCFSLGIFVLGTGVIFAIYAPYYRSWSDLISTTAAVQEAGAAFGKRVELLTNLFRFFGFPAYFFQVWLAFGIYAAFTDLRRGATEETKAAFRYLLLVAGPYLFILLGYFPHAGYLCLAGPVLIVFPLIFPSMKGAWLKMAGVFAVIALAQIFLVKPVTPKSLTRCVADAYFFQYSKAGLDSNMFESLALLAWKNGIMVDKIPKDRIKQAESIYGEPKGEKSERLDHGQ